MPGLAAVLLLASAASAQVPALSVSLEPSIPSPSPLGTVITFTASAAGNSGSVWYRFRTRRVGADFHTVRDYSPSTTFDWTAVAHEGLFEIEVTASDTNTGTTAVATNRYQMTSLVKDSPVITATANPLVFLYSAPPCPVESRMRVEFQSPDGAVQYTPYQPCRHGLSMNFYLAGLRANTAYSIEHIIDSGFGFTSGPAVPLTTPSVSVQVPASSVLQQPAPGAGLLLHSSFFGPPFATDLSGNLVWYYPGKFALLTRPEPGGRLLALVAQQAATGFGQILREFDLAGNTLRETNVDRVNQQLAALGDANIGVFHHDAILLPDGKIAVLASTEQILTDVQGPGPVDVLGDMILVLDRNLQVVWTWNSFDHLDPRRMATLGETCPGAGCPPLSLAKHANDWLHGNALLFTADGNLVYSTRHQDWILKIDYDNGNGAGDVIWRLGQDGDFQMNSTEPSPWFSHQHGPQFAPFDDSILTVFDDSNVRQSVDSKAHSRGQVLRLDEQNMTATLLIDLDLGGFSFAAGNAEELSNGDYHFGGGWLPDFTSLSIDTDAGGDLLDVLRLQTPEYRSFRMRDLYTP